MKKALKIFRGYFFVHSFLFALGVAYLILNCVELISVKPLLLASFIWLNIAFITLSVFYFIYRFKYQQEQGVSKLEVFFMVLINALFILTVIFDPFYIWAKALG